MDEPEPMSEMPMTDVPRPEPPKKRGKGALVVALCLALTSFVITLAFSHFAPLTLLFTTSILAFAAIITALFLLWSPPKFPDHSEPETGARFAVDAEYAANSKNIVDADTSNNGMDRSRDADTGSEAK